MHGEEETINVSDNGAVIEVGRGSKGAALINLSASVQEVSLATNLPDGTYTDKVNNTTFTVADGKIAGSLQPLTSYLIY